MEFLLLLTLSAVGITAFGLLGGEEETTEDGAVVNDGTQGGLTEGTIIEDSNVVEDDGGLELEPEPLFIGIDQVEWSEDVLVVEPSLLGSVSEEASHVFVTDDTEHGDRIEISGPQNAIVNSSQGDRVVETRDADDKASQFISVSRGVASIEGGGSDGYFFLVDGVIQFKLATEMTIWCRVLAALPWKVVAAMTQFLGPTKRYFLP